MRKIEAVVRQEMEAIGAQEVLFPALLPREPYEKTNRWSEYGQTMFRLKDRREADYLLAPTHEEMFALLIKDTFSSYKDLPCVLYQIQTKYRDELRARAGLLRGREFVMKDAYSFDIDDSGLEQSYMNQRRAYKNVFDRLGVPYYTVQANSGAMGGSMSEEFLSPSFIGDDAFAVAPSGKAYNVEAISGSEVLPVDYAYIPPAHKIHTPGAKTIDDLVEIFGEVGGASSLGAGGAGAAEALGGFGPVGSGPGKMPGAVGANSAGSSDEKVPGAAGFLKNVVLKVGSEIVVVGIPGDREIDEKRLEVAFYPNEVSMATPEDLKDYPELVAGFIGPHFERVARKQASRNEGEAPSVGEVGEPAPANPREVGAPTGAGSNPHSHEPAHPAPTNPPAPRIKYYVDPKVGVGTEWISGANETDYHTEHLVRGRDFDIDGILDVAEVKSGDPSPDGSGGLEIMRGIEIGHIFALGRKYTESLGVLVLDQNGKQVTPTMGSYGIGISRLLAVLAELNSDERGLSWANEIAPAKVHIVATGKDAAVFDAADKLAKELAEQGISVLYDDRRKVSPGVKFKDSELIGIRTIVVVGKKLQDKMVEIKDRTGENLEEVSIGDACSKVMERL
jgi:prolyl-tRNA synthetase